ncbi:PREDICTED: uncharacterized protein LOC109131345 [Camelina sativa]|uniref:Uncharacterized protein LOC109131345 n=1 Tax=Camelina sativa TaxID=90675 RepID=A0ABM1RFG8_CAMSA|nr:PREDICTED: uncharacterized protein LOC109131345 [Camelina sativa]
MKMPCVPLYDAPMRSFRGGETDPKPRDIGERRSRSTMVRFFI